MNKKKSVRRFTRIRRKI